MLRVFVLVPLMMLSLAFAAWGATQISFSSEFSYASEAAPHLGGDDFEISSVRVDHRTGFAQIATVTAFGRLVSLDYYEAESGTVPALPTQPAKRAQPPGGPMVEGGGPVGIVARGKSTRMIEVRKHAPGDPSAMQSDPAWVAFSDTLRAMTRARVAGGSRGIYLQLRASENNVFYQSTVKVSQNEARNDPVLSKLIGAPFAFIKVANETDLKNAHTALNVSAGQSINLSIRGKSFIVTRYDLR